MDFYIIPWHKWNKKTNILYVKSKCPSLIDMPKLLIMIWKTLSLKMFGNFRDEDSSMQ